MAAKHTAPVVHQLQALARRYPDLEEAAAVYAALLPVVNEADLRVVPLTLTPDEARAKLKSGVPLLDGTPLALDDTSARQLLIRLARCLEAVPGGVDTASGRAVAASQIRDRLEEGKLEAAILLQQVGAGDEAGVIAAAAAADADAALLWTLARHALRSALRDWARPWLDLAGSVAWSRSDCLICGASALLGELQGNEAEKHLRCGQCGADWPIRRLQCVFCGNDDHRTLRYFYSDDQPSSGRVDVCDRCHGYLKIITTFAPTPFEELLYQDLATVHLDYMAQAQGYVPGGKTQADSGAARPMRS